MENVINNTEVCRFCLNSNFEKIFINGDIKRNFKELMNEEVCMMQTKVRLNQYKKSFSCFSLMKIRTYHQIVVEFV